ncbi:MAG: tetratricopeptide repeat protein [Deltaproteobacteria bacterium]|nr:tetratricopeptide repeat protein [Deltaproteobacteria bacterium]
MHKQTKTLFVAILLSFLGASTTAFAQAQTPKEQARVHFNKGFAYYQAGQYLQAVRELKAAYRIRPVPLVLYYIGKTYKAAQINEEALTYFQRFLDEARLTDPHRQEVQQIIKSMGGNTKPLTATAPTTTIPTPRAAPPAARPRPRPKRHVKPGEIIHEVIEEARPHLPLLIEAELPDEIEWARLYLYFRTPGMEQFVKQLMKPGRRGVYSYLIHRSYSNSKSLQYYIEAVGRTGKRIAGSGTATSPNIVLLSNDAPLQPGGRMDDSAQPAIGGTAASRKGTLFGSGSQNGGSGTGKKNRSQWSLYGAIGLTAATVALVAAGVGLGVTARNRAIEVANEGAPRIGGSWGYPPSTAFDTSLQRSQDQGKSYQVGSIICYVLSAGAAGGAVYMWLHHFGVVGGKKTDKQQSSVTPILGRKTVGLTYGRSF